MAVGGGVGDVGLGMGGAGVILPRGEMFAGSPPELPDEGILPIVIVSARPIGSEIEMCDCVSRRLPITLTESVMRCTKLNFDPPLLLPPPLLL